MLRLECRQVGKTCGQCCSQVERATAAVNGSHLVHRQSPSLSRVARCVWIVGTAAVVVKCAIDAIANKSFHNSQERHFGRVSLLSTKGGVPGMYIEVPFQTRNSPDTKETFSSAHNRLSWRLDVYFEVSYSALLFFSLLYTKC